MYAKNARVIANDVNEICASIKGTGGPVLISTRPGDLDDRLWVGRVTHSSRLQQATGSRFYPRRVTIKVISTDHPASCLAA